MIVIAATNSQTAKLQENSSHIALNSHGREDSHGSTAAVVEETATDLQQPLMPRQPGDDRA